MIKVIKGNQIIIIVIAIMLIAVGYLNFNVDSEKDYIATLSNEESKENIGDAKLVNSDSAVSAVDEYSYKEALVENNSEILKEDTVYTNTKDESKESVKDDYFTISKLERESMYSQMLETYNKMCESPDISNEQKAIASNEIKNITNIKNAIMISENLIKTKDFEDVVIFVNNDSINLVVKSSELSKEQVAQLQNIISREMGANIQNIHISNKY